jgi:hypothetical protein
MYGGIERDSGSEAFGDGFYLSSSDATDVSESEEKSARPGPWGPQRSERFTETTAATGNTTAGPSRQVLSILPSYSGRNLSGHGVDNRMKIETCNFTHSSRGKSLPLGLWKAV